jgi:hypothetical protein
MRKVCCVLLCSTVWGFAFGQNPESLMEELAQTGRFNPDDCEEILGSRISLNAVTEEELQMTGFLSLYQVRSLLDYRERYGDFFTWAEIHLIPGFTKKEVQWLALFFTLEPKPRTLPLNLRSLVRNGRRSLMLQTRTFFPRGEPYSPVTEQEYQKRPNSRYLGVPWYRYARYQFNYYGKLQWGFTLESDPGERALADFVSCHMNLQNRGSLKSFVVGDFRARFGQGLLVWNGTHFGASLTPASLFKKEMGLTGYTSRDENRSFRGAGATFSVKDFDISVFGSCRKLDARILRGGFTSLVETGYHRTPLETEKKNTLTAWATGVHVSYKGKGWKVGTTVLGYGYDKPDSARITYYNQFKNRVLPFGGLAVDYSGRHGSWLVFSELATDAGLSPAFLGGVIHYGRNGAREALVIRCFTPSFTSAYGTDAGRNSSSSNEYSVQFSACRDVFGKWNLTGNAWFYFFPVSRYLCRDKSYGWDYRVQLQQDDHLFSLRQQRSLSDKGITDKQCLRLQTMWSLTGNLSLGLRADAVNSILRGTKSEWGTAAYVQLACRDKNEKFIGSFRVGVFNTRSWDSRIYVYESDVLYGFSVPALYGKGIRSYLNVKYTPLPYMDLWFRVSCTYRDKPDLDTKLQVRIRF